MAGDVFARVGLFQASTSAASQDFTFPGVTKTCKGAIVEVLGPVTALNTFTDDISLSVGFADATFQCSNSCYARHAAEDSETNRGSSETRGVRVLTTDGIGGAEVEFRGNVTMIAGGVRIVFDDGSATPAAPPRAVRLRVEAFFGDDLSAEAGTLDVDQAVDVESVGSLGIDPDVIFTSFNELDHIDSVSAQCAITQGFAINTQSGIVQGCNAYQNSDARANMLLSAGLDNTRNAIRVPIFGTAVIQSAFEITTLSPILGVTKRTASFGGAFADRIGYLALNIDDRRAAIVSTQSPANATTAYTQTGIGFRGGYARLLLVQGNSVPFFTNTAGSDSVGTFAFDAQGGGGTASIADDDGAAASQATSALFDSLEVSSIQAGSPVSQVNIAIPTFDADGWSTPPPHVALQSQVTALALVIEEAAANEAIGTLDATEAADVAALLGAVDVDGALSVTEAADVAAFVGTLDVDGTLSVVEAADVAALVGIVDTAAIGTLSALEAPDVAVLTAQVIAEGDLKSTEAADVAALTGNIFNNLIGDLAAVEAADTAALLGTIDVDGTLSVVEGADVAELVGIVASDLNVLEAIFNRVDDIWRNDGLEPGNPMTVTPTSRSTQDGTVSLTLTGDGVTTKTVTRNN